MRAHAASEHANARTYAHTSVHLYAHVRSLVRSHVHSSVHSFALRSSPRPLATRTPYVHRVSWSFKSIVYEALKKAKQRVFIRSKAHSFSRKRNRASGLKLSPQYQYKFPEGPGTQSARVWPGMGYKNKKVEKCLILLWVCSPT